MGVQIPYAPQEGAILRGKGQRIVNYRDYRPCAAVMRPFCQITLTTCYICICNSDGSVFRVVSLYCIRYVLNDECYKKATQKLSRTCKTKRRHLPEETERASESHKQQGRDERPFFDVDWRVTATP